QDIITFEFLLEHLSYENKEYLLTKPVKIRLTWYHIHPSQPLMAGQEWRFSVRLKRPHGLLNPGGFDYEKWLFAHGLRATGVVLQAKILPQQHIGWKYALTLLRQKLQLAIQASLANEATTGLVIALVTGAQSGISQYQWQIMRATGTNHLMAIAGVH